MRDSKPEDLMMLIGQLDYNLVLYERHGWTDERKAEFLRHWTALAELCDHMGLPTTAGSCRTHIESIHTRQTYAIEHLDEAVRQTRRVLYEEMHTLAYFEIPPSQIHLWKSDRPFGPEVWKIFPDARADIEEAAKCLAVDRGTACVLHVARAMEHILRAFGAALGAVFKPTDDWQEMLDEIDKLIKPMSVATSADVAKKDICRQAHADLGRVKLAWRLPAAHSRGTWTPEQAEEVFGSCKAFSKHVVKVI